MKELFTAIATFQGECPTISKNKKGAWGNYSDLSGVKDTIQPFLAKNGLLVVQPLKTIGEDTYIVTIIGHVSGESIAYETKIDFEAKDAQKFGALITYFRRYALCSALNLVSDDDVDDFQKLNGENPNEKAEYPKKTVKANPKELAAQAKPKEFVPLSEDQQKQIRLMVQAPNQQTWFLKQLEATGYKKLVEVPQERFGEIVEHISKNCPGEVLL